MDFNEAILFFKTNCEKIAKNKKNGTVYSLEAMGKHYFRLESFNNDSFNISFNDFIKEYEIIN